MRVALLQPKSFPSAILPVLRQSVRPSTGRPAGSDQGATAGSVQRLDREGVQGKNQGYVG